MAVVNTVLLASLFSDKFYILYTLVKDKITETFASLFSDKFYM